MKGTLLNLFRHFRAFKHILFLRPIPIKIVFTIFTLAFAFISYSQPSTCVNADFESGNLSGWVGKTGSCCPINTPTTGIVAGRHTIMTGAGLDPNSCNAIPVVAPGGLFSARLGNSNNGAQAERLLYTFPVTSSNPLFIYKYAVILQDPNHPQAAQPRFGVRVLNSNGQVVDPTCGQYNVVSGPGIPGFFTCGNRHYRPWTTVGLNLSAYIGQNITIEFSTGDCDYGGHYGYAYIDCYCSPLTIDVSYCNGSSATLTAPIGFTYVWTPGGATTQSITIPNPINGATYSCLMTSPTGCKVTLTSVIHSTKPTANFTVNTNCINNVIFTDASTTPPGSTLNSWTWTFGDGGSSILQNPTHSYATPGTYNVKLIVKNVQGCRDTIIIPITVIASSLPPTSATASPNPNCGGPTTLTEIGGTLGIGAVYNWYTGSCGGTFVGTGASINVSPTATTTYYVRAQGTCNTTTCASVTVTVNVAPFAVATPTSRTICCGGNTSIALSSFTPGTTFAWTVAQAGVTGASAGSGASISQTLCTSGTTQGTATYTITPTANGCTGNPITVVITVNPTPVATATPPAQTICSGDTTHIALTSNVPGTTFSWTVVQAGGVAGASNGSGATIVQTLTSGTTQGTATYTITPTAGGGCVGSPITVVVAVNPKPVATATPSSQTICSGTATSIVLTSNIPGTTFSYTVVQAGGVTGGSSGTGNSIAQTLTTITTAGTATYTIASLTSVGCNGDPVNVVVTVNPKDSSSFSYSSPSFCQTGLDPSANITGLPGGTFSSTPAGLVILNTSTGLIDVSASTVGVYTVKYTTNGVCPDIGTFTLTITAANPPPGFSYPGSPFCQFASNPAPVFNPGASAGTFSATPAGLVFVSVNTGVINLATSLPGTYTVKNVISGSGGCAADSATSTVTINPTPIATATPALSTICSGTSTSIVLTSNLPGTTYAWTVTQNGVTGATAGSGSSISQVLTSSTIGTAIYTIVPTVGTCTGAPVMDTVTVNPITVVTATPPAQTICSGGTTGIALTGSISGTTFAWTVSTAGVTGASLGSGALISQTLTATGNTPGTAIYTVTPTAIGCSGIPINVTITVKLKDNTGFTYSSGTYCTSGTTATPTITGLPGGVFSATPSGLSLNPTTGTITLSTSTIGTYNLCYHTNGTCPDSSCITMTITNTTPSANFSYVGGPFCQNGNDPAPVFGSGASAGTFTASPAGLVFVNANTGVIDLSASVPGTYTVTNSIPPSGTCLAATATTTVVITNSDNASFTYSSATYCKSGTPQTPNISGFPGGTFSSTPVGLSIDSVTGTITLSTSQLGSYTLSYTTHGPCPNTSSITMTIDSLTPVATFSYPGGPFCQSGNDPSPIYGVGASAGVFSATPVGLVFVHINTGQIDLSASSPGTYTVTNTIPASGSCAAAIATTTVTISSMDDASFVYSSATYCQTGTNPTPAITGLPGGTFTSSPAGLSINPSTGAINLATSIVGSYTVTYSTSGPCPNTNSITISITANITFAGFHYTATTYCKNGTNPLPVFDPGATAGVFTTNPIGLAFVNINTGEIDLASSLPGTYYVTNTVQAGGGCSGATAVDSVVILPADNASFVYTSATYCISGNPQTPIITGFAGGTFSSTPWGLSINPSTGTITLSASWVGVYTLSYTTNGVCPSTSSITMTITNSTPYANFDFPGSPFCQNSVNPSPVFGTGASAGIFTASPGGLVFVHVNTGQIDLAASTPGTYIVTNTIPPSGTCGAVSAIDTVTIGPADDASFVYSSATYCQTGPNPTPSITGLAGGTFSALPPGLSINPTTGTINLTTSAVGAYTLTYTTNGPCPNTSSIVMTINSTNSSATFSYPGSPFCQNGTNPYPTFATGASAGTFTSSPAGLVFVHVNTGQINLSASATGTYTITNTIPASGGCAAVVATSTITINVPDDASFVYTSATYCTSGNPQTPLSVATPGGTFFATPPGLSVNPSTGTITLSTSTLGVYTLYYRTNGTCPDTSSITMTITNTTPFANISYPGSPFCQFGTNPYPNFGPGASAGTFTASPAGLVFVHVNTGQINLSLSAPGTYVVTNTIPASGTCGAVSATTTVVIGGAPVAVASTTSANICTQGATSINLTSSTPGTTFAWTVIPTNVTGTAPGSGSTISQTLTYLGTTAGSAVYTITPTAGGCPGLPITVTVTVHALPVVDTSSIVITKANCGSTTGGILGVSMTSGHPPYTYQWKDSLGNIVGNSVDLGNVGKGKYTLTVTDSNGCVSSIAGPFTVTATPSVIAAFTANPVTGQTPLTVNFTNNSSANATIYLWEFGTGDTSHAKNPSYVYVPLGDFTVCLIADNGFGCSDTICDSINVFINSAFIVPNIFTPNGDNINDVFSIKGQGLKTLEVIIFNRWGQKVHTINTVNGGWDGRTASGVPAVSGTYYYIINATGVDDKKYFEKGAFELIRDK